MSRLQRLTCVLFLLVGLAIALCSIAHRHSADKAYRDVTVLVDWHGLISLAEPGGTQLVDSNHELAWQLLSKLTGAQLVYSEETVGTLLDQGIIAPAWGSTGAPAYIAVGLAHERALRLGAERHGYWLETSEGLNGRLIIQFPNLPEEDLMLLPVAWLDAPIEAARERNVPIVLRPGGSEFLGPTGLVDTLDFAAEQPLMLFAGPTVLGYPHQLGIVAGQLKEQGQQFGWIEFDEQDGGGGLAGLMSPSVIRVHSIPPEEMVNYDTDSAVARYMRAVNERGIRCLYVRPFIRGDVLGAPGQTGAGFREQLAGVNAVYFGKLAGALTDAGYRIAAEPATPQDVPGWLKLIRPLAITLAVGAAGIMLFAMWLPGWPRWVWWVLLVITAIKSAVAMLSPTVDAAVRFGAAIFFPLLGFWWALLIYQRLVARLACRPGCPRRIYLAVLALLVASLTSVAGGLLIHGGMWSAEAMLKLTQFRGVTLSLGLPLLLLAAYAWHAETLVAAYDAGTRRLTGYWERFTTLWQAPIRYGDVAFILIAVLALAVVLLRSGNDSLLGVSSLETAFRGGLEQLFAVRPRTKELIGHPLLILFLVSLPWRARVSLLLALAGLLAQVSILNTFCHLHTPIMVTVQRVLIGIGAGLVVGIILAALAQFVWWIADAMRGKLQSTGTQV